MLSNYFHIPKIAFIDHHLSATNSVRLTTIIAEDSF